MNQAYQSNMATASFRADHPQAQTLFTREQAKTIWTRSLERLEDAGLGWTKGARDLRAKLAEMGAN